MDFDLSERQRHWRDRRRRVFTEKYIEPAEATYHKQEKGRRTAGRSFRSSMS